MSRLIRFLRTQQPTLTQTDWQIWQPQDDEEGVPAGKHIISFKYWLTHREDHQLLKRAVAGEIGVWFAATDDVLDHKQLIHAGQKLWPMVAVHFPIFRDGRGYSTAALLRERLAWTGPVWAIGDVLIDQLDQLARVGFDHFVLRADQDLELGMHKFEQFSVRMQDSWRYPRTLNLTHQAEVLSA
jgi:uncharacterized protein (DUF934 family)